MSDRMPRQGSGMKTSLGGEPLSVSRLPYDFETKESDDWNTPEDTAIWWADYQALAYFGDGAVAPDSRAKALLEARERVDDVELGSGFSGHAYIRVTSAESDLAALYRPGYLFQLASATRTPPSSTKLWISPSSDCSDFPPVLVVEMDYGWMAVAATDRDPDNFESDGNLCYSSPTPEAGGAR